MTVGIIATGGTIANTASGRIGIDALLDDVRAAASPADRAVVQDVLVEEPLRRGADQIGPADWILLAQRATSLLERPELTGLVITHGTYTAEETGFFLHLVVRSPKPIVISCSQRRHGAVGNDGDRNLLDAMRIARDLGPAALGAILVEAGTIHSLRDVIKTSQHPGGFWSPHGPIGSVEDDRITIRYRVERDHTVSTDLVAPATLEGWPRVDVLSAYAGADDAAVHAFVAAGARGIVVDGFSYRGLPAPGQRAALETAAAAGTVVVLANRGRVGRIPVDEGSPFLSAGDLLAHKARILVALALASGVAPADFQRTLERY